MNGVEKWLKQWLEVHASLTHFLEVFELRIRTNLWKKACVLWLFYATGSY
jgi:hypothetical protein